MNPSHCGKYISVIGVNKGNTMIRARHDSYDDAVRHLAIRLKLGLFKEWRLHWKGHVKLSWKKYGADYCFVAEANALLALRPPTMTIWSRERLVAA